MTAILVTEEHPPAGQTAVCWRLLTTWPVEELGDALALVEVYTRRWLVERYHYVLKSGCRIEELQLEEADRLDRALATYSLVAWRVLWLTYLARAEPESSSQLVLTEAEQAVLVARFGDTLGNDPGLGGGDPGGGQTRWLHRPNRRR